MIGLMPCDRHLESLVCRRVRYSYRRRTFEFDLSQALFSSAGVDAGTQLLLGLIAGRLATESFSRVVDVGCGAGTLGVAVAGSCGARLEALDRDALAVAFTERNARLNSIERADVYPALSPPQPRDDRARAERELVVCNLPAKAGEPVLRMLVSRMIRLAEASQGACALVIVTPLAEFLENELRASGAEVIADRRTANHLAVYARGGALREAGGPDELSAFFRTVCDFQGPRGQYRLQTVYNLPEFDGLSYRTALAFDLLSLQRVAGSAVLYGCGQGHLLVGLSQMMTRNARLVVADRDLLALKIAGSNAEHVGLTGVRREIVPGLSAVADVAEPGSVDWLVVNDDPVPGSTWNDAVADSAGRMLGPTGQLLLVSRSTSVSRFERHVGRRFRVIADRRMHGFRATLFRRRH